MIDTKNFNKADNIVGYIKKHLGWNNIKDPILYTAVHNFLNNKFTSDMMAKYIVEKMGELKYNEDNKHYTPETINMLQKAESVCNSAINRFNHDEQSGDTSLKESCFNY